MRIITSYPVEEKILSNLQEIYENFKNSTFEAEDYVRNIKTGKFGSISVFVEIPDTPLRLTVSIDTDGTTTKLIYQTDLGTQYSVRLDDTDAMRKFLSEHDQWQNVLSLFVDEHWNDIKKSIYQKIQQGEYLHLMLYHFRFEKK